ncbi:MAG: ubiquitin-like protein Pup [Candidatus Sungbacteria bacterium]|nr:ubiquitin-like protein Pup [Candidatus Sungbacteria bacterium]
MADQKKKDVKTDTPKPEDTEVTPNPKLQEKADKAKEGLDELLDEIDDILEENAEEFVKTYVQRGGE